MGQVLLARENGLRRQGGRLNIVMMGQGEPLLNLDNVLKATRILLDPAGFALSPRRVTVSTAGIVPGIEELGRQPVRPRLAISLNASTEESRQELMPITRKYHLKDLLAACKAYPLRPWEKLTFEYVLLKGVNDSDADARRVLKLLANPQCQSEPDRAQSDRYSVRTPDAGRVTGFGTSRRGSCFIRKPRGLDIYAACGTQAQQRFDSRRFAAIVRVPSGFEDRPQPVTMSFGLICPQIWVHAR